MITIRENVLKFSTVCERERIHTNMFMYITCKWYLSRIHTQSEQSCASDHRIALSVRAGPLGAAARQQHLSHGRAKVCDGEGVQAPAVRAKLCRKRHLRGGKRDALTTTARWKTLARFYIY